MRIGDLAQRTGVSREMIKYYLRAGLLPQPDKPRANLSLYSEQHVSLVNLILRFQAQTRLALADIAEVFSGAAYDPGAIELELLSARHTASDGETILPLEAADGETAHLTLPDEFLAQLKDHGLIESSASPSEEERQSAGLLWAAYSEGIPMDYFVEARESIHALATLQVKTLLEIERPHLQFGEVIESITDVDRIINRWIISEKTRHARTTFARILENAEKALSSVHDAIYVPSDVFRTRHAVAATLDRIETDALTKTASAATLDNACRTAVLLADYARAIRIADHALSLRHDDALFLAYRCLALAMDKRLDDATVWARKLAPTSSRHPVVLEARLLTLLMEAARLSGVSDSSQLLKEAAELFRDPADVPANSPADEVEANLLEARAKTLFPDAYAWREGARGRLENTLAALTDTPGLQLPHEVLRAVYTVYTAYYLGQLYREEGKAAQAASCFETVIKLDPASNFGQMAYLQLT